MLILLHEKLLQFDWLRAVVFQLNLKYRSENYKTFVGAKYHSLKYGANVIFGINTTCISKLSQISHA